MPSLEAEEQTTIQDFLAVRETGAHSSAVSQILKFPKRNIKKFKL
jgi:hypothetical protein